MFQCLNDMPTKQQRTKVNLYLEELSYRGECPRAFPVVVTSIEHFHGTCEWRFAKGLPLVLVLGLHRIFCEEKKNKEKKNKPLHILWLN